MKSIEERAKEVGILYQLRSDYPYDKKSIMAGYIKGAADQKVIDIDKAWQWIKNNIYEMRLYGLGVCENHFRKAMEK